jgi:ABC-type transport system involved in multi-copper enzyme maturation permease subunit
MSRPASTHTEIYRPFEGQLAPHALRFVPLCASQVRVLQKKKLPLLLFYGAPAITGITLSFVVYTKFTLEAEFEGSAPPAGLDMKQAMMLAAAKAATESLLEVRNIISMANLQIQAFALLAIAWFGAGLIADDKRLGAHLLYFSRPMSKLDYCLGHFMTACWFGLIAMLGPGLLVCLVATFTSPDYAFIRQEWGVVLATIANALFTVAFLALFTLAISSLFRRKSFALVTLIGLTGASMPVGGMLSGLQNDMDWMMVGLWSNIARVGDWMFSLSGEAQISDFDWDVRWSFAILGGVAALSGAILWRQVRRLEGVG